MGWTEVPRRLSVQLMVGVTIALFVMLGANLVLVWHQQQETLLSEMHARARVMTDEILAVRLFVARNQDRINTDSLGHFEFKGLNPAAVGRGVGTILNDITGYKLKQTRFQVRRAENAPDRFDWEALTEFSENAKLAEFYKQMEEDGKPVFRYAVPLRIAPECLVCHGGPPGEPDIAGYPKEGYKEGQLGGAISVTLPMSESMARIQRNAMIQIWVIAAITGGSLLVIYVLSRRLVTDPLERLTAVTTAIGGGRLQVAAGELEILHRSRELGTVADNIESMAASLRDMYTHLELKVAERTQELAHANQLQSQFLATVSHELRTPLTSIIAFTELLLKQAAGQQREYLEDVLESGRRLLEMVNNLLDLSRLEAGRVELFPDVVELPEMLIAVERSLRPLAERKQIALTIEAPGEMPLVMVDPLRVKQVLLNLVGNAIKFTPEGGQIVISSRPRDGWVEVSVRDNGPGVPDDQRNLIFEAFRRIESLGHQHPGSGLGLALARNLIELHGGQIGVEDAPGGGSIFRFTLPVAPNPHEEEDELNGGQ